MFKKPWVWLVGIVLLGILIRLFTYGFIKIPWIVYDEFTYLDTARQIIRGNFTSVFNRDQLYPGGWPLILTTFVGYFHDPNVQYKAALIVTMVLSSLVPVCAYIMTGSLTVALLTSFYPPLFVYSSSILSETAYTLLLFGAVVMFREMVRDDLRSKWQIVLSGVIFGFVLYYISLTRSFGIIHIPALLISWGAFHFFTRRNTSLLVKKNIGAFVLIAVVMYMVSGLIVRQFTVSPGKLYEQMPYITALQLVISKPLLFMRLLQNEAIIVLVSLFWILPIFFAKRTKESMEKKEWHEVLTRIFLVLALLASVALTVAHMAKTVQNNSQYLIFSRYIDPTLTVLFAYSLGDLFHWIKTHDKKWKLPLWWVGIIGYFLIYLRLGYYFGQYKFGNTMPVYFLSLIKSNFFFYPMLIGFVVTMLVAIWRKWRRLLYMTIVVFFVYQSVIAIRFTTDVPRYVQNKHYMVISEWQQALAQPGNSTPLCLMPQALWGESYYLYHFLHPYQYLKYCDSFGQNRPKWFIISAKSTDPVPKGCEFTFGFSLSGGDGLFYCPKGMK
ncbi:MAG: hypothetical protein WC775_06025 [Patescibacteria group bacterium]|jgi:hypothetical protein